tara:strand:+ start:3342 stop:3965 length:624 start_codon:yes stop_codon:yes gene_type:complete
MKFQSKDIKKLNKVYRLNLINSITGIKPGNLIATKSKSGEDNVAIFSSVVHLGSSPAQIGFVLRPQKTRKSDTYINITDSKFYTINHISKEMYVKAHNTSIKDDVSEFDLLNIKKEFKDDFYAPYVKKSPIKLGMKMIDMIELPNDCLFVIGEIENLYIESKLLNLDGTLDLEVGDIMGIGGLNTYYELNKIDTLPYVRNIDDITNK